jgi:sarcosine oxidase subunit gamma
MTEIAFHLLPQMARWSVRAGEAAAGEIEHAFGVALPREACRAATNGVRSALWLGPDEWLLIAPEGEAAETGAALIAAAERAPASVVDIAHRQVAIAVSGARVTDVLNAGNPLDLDPAAFPVGMCTRTVFAKAEVVLWRTGADAFHVEVWRSFAPYVLGLIEEAARDTARAEVEPRVPPHPGPRISGA